ncbi:leucine-rich repeat-containing protein 61-like isoform X2 [Dendronephthya gigantea]|uniref:leucine-rich repeat-containing protein 61-like isoform X2 n=1 Tax=Dendronephthya gigantea TaxID=151771 RepID=UPI00106CECB1|nr:leucine-rich repeat-containing protein 61-like isoform X2 [Dendronephthya gigantea]
MNTDSVITCDMLKKITGEFDVTSIIKLNANKLGIKDLGIIGQCSGLMYLDLSENRISDLRPLEQLKDLTTLDISCNTVTDLAGLEGLESLETLNISGNLITSIDSLQPLVNLKFLECLRLEDRERNISNPVCQTLPQYKTSICKYLPNISMLDGERTLGEGAEVFKVCDDLKTKLTELEEKELEEDSFDFISGFSDTLDKKQNATEKKMAWSAEQQFEDVLKQCRSLNEEADKAILDAKNALWGASKGDVS